MCMHQVTKNLKTANECHKPTKHVRDPSTFKVSRPRGKMVSKTLTKSTQCQPQVKGEHQRTTRDGVCKAKGRPKKAAAPQQKPPTGPR